MDIEKKSLRNMMVVNLIIGVITTAIIKVYKPEYCTISGVMSAMFNSKELIAVVYIIMSVMFVILSYVICLLGIYIIGARTIGRFIRLIKEIFSNNINDRIQDRDYLEDYSYTDVAIISAYIFLLIPLMLYILWPAVSVLLLIILIIYAITSC